MIRATNNIEYKQRQTVYKTAYYGGQMEDNNNIKLWKQYIGLLWNDGFKNIATAFNLHPPHVVGVSRAVLAVARNLQGNKPVENVNEN